MPPAPSDPAADESTAAAVGDGAPAAPGDADSARAGGDPSAAGAADVSPGGGPVPAADEGPALSRPGTARPEIAVVRFPGRVPYREGLELQRRLARDRIEGRLGRDLLLLLEHEPVLTFGRGTEEGHLRAGRERLEETGVETVEIERGGDVTYHGPGQLVGYPILDLGSYRKDLHWYLRAVEEALIRALGELGLPAFRVPEHTGVWVGEEAAAAGPADAVASAVLDGRVRKIASIGVHVSRWVTWHGFALNVTEEPMENFRLIVPCGIRGVRMTSLHGEGVAVGRGRARDAVAAGFASTFDARTVDADGVGDLDLPDGAGRGSGARAEVDARPEGEAG